MVFHYLSCELTKYLIIKANESFYEITLQRVTMHQMGRCGSSIIGASASSTGHMWKCSSILENIHWAAGKILLIIIIFQLIFNSNMIFKFIFEMLPKAWMRYSFSMLWVMNFLRSLGYFGVIIQSLLLVRVLLVVYFMIVRFILLFVRIPYIFSTN